MLLASAHLVLQLYFKLLCLLIALSSFHYSEPSVCKFLLEAFILFKKCLVGLNEPVHFHFSALLRPSPGLFIVLDSLQVHFSLLLPFLLSCLYLHTQNGQLLLSFPALLTLS